jgi:hypothetical protein
VSAALTPGQVYRVGVRVSQGTGANAVLQVYLASGNDAFGSAFTSTATGAWTEGVTRLRIGATGGTIVLQGVIDDVKIDSAVMPGPSN